MKKRENSVDKALKRKQKRKNRGKILIWIGLIAILGSVVFATGIALYGYFSAM